MHSKAGPRRAGFELFINYIELLLLALAGQRAIRTTQ